MLILDGPTVGVDIRNKQGIYEWCVSWPTSGMAILLISDEVPEVYFNCDRVLHMRDGRIVGEYVPGAAASSSSRRRSMRSLRAPIFGRTETRAGCGDPRRRRDLVAVARPTS